MSFYPLRFKTQYKDKIWGGQKLKTVLGKDFGNLPNCGETWEISGVPGNVSQIINGAFAGKTLQDVLDQFQHALVGNASWETYGREFPLLVKFIDANDDLSIQVHPDDKLARKRHDCFGKTEMWYIMQADDEALLNTGFAYTITKEEYLKHLSGKTLHQILNFEAVQAGDVFFLPAGRVHYIGKGILLAEIQQSSDITYRIYDFDRKDDKGNKRELHTEQALDAIDFKGYPEYKSKYTERVNESSPVVECPFFVTSVLPLQGKVARDFSHKDSMVIYVCIQGSGQLSGDFTTENFTMGDCFLIPAALKQWALEGDAKLLEVYIP
ncbi:MAG: class I mannose-6-phosphate isomerase [Cytophagaceae bacterium]|jgi:mannose-6-phosphate isomerase|nr:class I mannose-6-phosphate isomerase [Cytophagaceae bacterium]